MRPTLLVLLLAVACVPVGEDEDPDHTDVHTDDTDDTDPPPEAGPTTWTLGEEVVCDDPSVRESTPFLELRPGGDWADQPVDPGSDALFVGGGVGVGDLDGDGLLDLLDTDRTTAFTCWRQTRSEGGLLGFEACHDGLPPMPEKTGAVALADVEGDGDLDALVAVFKDHDVLLINDGTGAFTDEAAARGVAGPASTRSLGASWADIDGDGDLDAFVGGYGKLSNSEGRLPPGDPSRILVQQEDGTFVDIAPDLFGDLETTPHPLATGHTFTGGFTDVDGDLDPDLFLVNDFGWRFPTRLLRNPGDGAFAPPVDEGLELRAENMGLGMGDVNDDGVTDFLVAAWDDLALFLSSPSGWYDAADSVGLELDFDRDQRTAWGAELVDLDNDGDLDAVVALGYLPVTSDNANPGYQPDGIWLQQDDGTFVDVAPEWGMAHRFRGRGFVAVDLDRNGFLDLIKPDLRGPMQIHMAQCSERAWLGIRPTQPGPNPFAVGARVTVRDGDRSWWREVRAGGTSYGSSGPPEVHLGLGDADTVDVEIRWPDGAVSRREDVPTRRWIDVHRGETP